MAETWATTNEGGRQASDWAELDKLVRCSAHGPGTAESTAGPTAESAPRKVGKRLEERVRIGGSRPARGFLSFPSPHFSRLKQDLRA